MKNSLFEKSGSQQRKPSIICNNLKRQSLVKPIDKANKCLQCHSRSISQDCLCFYQRFQFQFMDQLKRQNQMTIKCCIDPCRHHSVLTIQLVTDPDVQQCSALVNSSNHDVAAPMWNAASCPIRITNDFRPGNAFFAAIAAAINVSPMK